MRTRLAPGFTADDLLDALRAHERCLAGAAGRILKDDARTRVTAIGLADGRRLVVKEVRAGGLGRRVGVLVRGSVPEREWRVGEELTRRGIAVARAQALALPGPLAARSGFVVHDELVGAYPVNRWVAGLGRDADARRKRRALLDAVADWLCALHAGGVEHRDLKGSNLLVRESGSRFELFPVDLSAVRFTGAISDARRAEALAQLSASTPLVVPRSERMRFVHRYLGAASREAARSLFLRADRLTRERNCVWDPDYAGREGVGPA